MKLGRSRRRSRIRRLGGLIGVLGLVLLFSFVCSNLVVWGVGRWKVQSEVNAVEPGAVGLILGAGPASEAVVNRLDAGLALWREGKIDWLLVSGGADGTGFSETAYMRRYLEREGVDSASILEDGLGLRTLDSVLRARDIFGIRRLVIVTQRYHLYRGVFLARCAGIETQGFVADPVISGGFWSSGGRELLARVQAMIDVVLRRGARYPVEMQAEWWESSETAEPATD